MLAFRSSLLRAGRVALRPPTATARGLGARFSSMPAARDVEAEWTTAFVEATDEFSGEDSRGPRGDVVFSLHARA